MGSGDSAMKLQINEQICKTATLNYAAELEKTKQEVERVKLETIRTENIGFYSKELDTNLAIKNGQYNVELKREETKLESQRLENEHALAMQRQEKSHQLDHASLKYEMMKLQAQEDEKNRKLPPEIHDKIVEEWKLKLEYAKLTQKNARSLPSYQEIDDDINMSSELAK